ncbi:MAG: hypothetical protein ABIH23_35300 [bacterium]
MKKLVAVLAVCFGVALSVFAEFRSDMVEMKNGTMTISMDSQFTPPKKVESISLTCPVGVTSVVASVRYRLRGNLYQSLYSGTFTNSSTVSASMLVAPTGIVASATDSIVVTSSNFTNCWIQLNYSGE